jgi:hypothetical protein
LFGHPHTKLHKYPVGWGASHLGTLWTLLTSSHIRDLFSFTRSFNWMGDHILSILDYGLDESWKTTLIMRERKGLCKCKNPSYIVTYFIFTALPNTQQTQTLRANRVCQGYRAGKPQSWDSDPN